MPLVPKYDFEGITSTPVLPEPVISGLFDGAYSYDKLPVIATPETFKGISPEAALVQPSPFAGIISKANLPTPLIKPTFEEITVSAFLPEPVKPDAFRGAFGLVDLPAKTTTSAFAGIIGRVALPVNAVTPETFAGTTSQPILPEASVLPKPDFAGISATLALPKPVDPLIFENVVGDGKVKVMFPGGQKVIPTYGVGVPLGAEKSLLEPRIRQEDKKEK
jgi:hypothetical protein